MINRKKLLDSLNLVKPALAVKDYIPILTHFMFSGESINAYNDILSINVGTDVKLEGCIPAELLIKTLKSLTTEDIAFERTLNHVLLTSGRSKIKLPVLPSTDFPETVKAGSQLLGSFKVTEDMLIGIKKCLVAAGNDTRHPSHMGITLEPMYSVDEIALYSTDNVTISCYVIKDKDTLLPGDKPVILPTLFCQQLLALSKLTLDIEIGIYNGALIARFEDKAVLFTKTLVDVKPINFMDVVLRYINPTHLILHDMPDEFEQSIERAVLVQEDVDYKNTTMVVSNKKLTIESISKQGEVTDDMSYAGDNAEFTIDPSLVKRVLEITSKVAMLRKVMVLADEDENFLHLISHRSV